MFNSSIASYGVIAAAFIILGVGLVLGLLLSLVYMFNKRKESYPSDFPLTLVMMPPAVAMVLFFINGNLGVSITIAGVFALTRFRSIQQSVSDLAYMFIGIVIGIIAGIGYVLFAVLIALILLLALLLLNFINFGIPHQNNMTLKIIVPENLSYDHLFDDILTQYCKDFNIIRVKTIDFGTLFEISFHLVLKGGASQKEMIDALRTRNGNLTITLTIDRYNTQPSK